MPLLLTGAALLRLGKLGLEALHFAEELCLAQACLSLCLLSLASLAAQLGFKLAHLVGKFLILDLLLLIEGHGLACDARVPLVEPVVWQYIVSREVRLAEIAVIDQGILLPCPVGRESDLLCQGRRALLQAYIDNAVERRRRWRHVTFEHIVERHVAKTNIGGEVNLDLSDDLCHAAAVAVVLWGIDHMQ